MPEPASLKLSVNINSVLVFVVAIVFTLEYGNLGKVMNLYPILDALLCRAFATPPVFLEDIIKYIYMKHCQVEVQEKCFWASFSKLKIIS